MPKPWLMLKRLRPPQRQAALITLTNHFTGAGFLKIKSLPKVTPKLLKQLAPVDVFLTVFDVSGKTCRPSEAMPVDRIQQHSAGDAASLTGQRQTQFSNSPTALRFRAASTWAIRQSILQTVLPLCLAAPSMQYGFGIAIWLRYPFKDQI